MATDINDGPPWIDHRDRAMLATLAALPQFPMAEEIAGALHAALVPNGQSNELVNALIADYAAFRYNPMSISSRFLVYGQKHVCQLLRDLFGHYALNTFNNVRVVRIGEFYKPVMSKDVYWLIRGPMKEMSEFGAAAFTRSDWMLSMNIVSYEHLTEHQLDRCALAEFPRLRAIYGSPRARLSREYAAWASYHGRSKLPEIQGFIQDGHNSYVREPARPPKCTESAAAQRGAIDRKGGGSQNEREATEDKKDSSKKPSVCSWSVRPMDI